MFTPAHWAYKNVCKNYRVFCKFHKIKKIMSIVASLPDVQVPSWMVHGYFEII